MINKHTPRKRFGQNFLQDQNCIQKIIAAINPQAGDKIIEIGPGQGALTQPLLKYNIELCAVEIDKDLAKIINQKFADYPQFQLHNQDALTFNFSSVYNNALPKVIGNLPYNISTPLLFHLFSFQECFSEMYFMLQKEVADRMCAQPGSKQYGRLSIMTQYFCKIDRLFIVPPSAFFPQPKVQSAIIRLIPYTKENRPFPTTDLHLFKNVVTSAFSQRRKKLSNSLKDLISSERLATLDIDPSSRPEALSIQEFILLTNSIKNQS